MGRRRANGEGNLRKRRAGTRRAGPRRRERLSLKNVLGKTQAEAKLKKALEESN